MNNKLEENRIYVVLPAVVEVAKSTYEFNGQFITDFRGGVRHVLQPHGRQIAQACHVVSKLRFREFSQYFSGTGPAPGECEPITTIILQARDSKELMHCYLMLRQHKLTPSLFSDENKDAYGDFKPITALAVLATNSQIIDILDYLPLWGS